MPAECGGDLFGFELPGEVGLGVRTGRSRCPATEGAGRVPSVMCGRPRRCKGFLWFGRMVGCGHVSGLFARCS